jgi:hypothetical protein
MPSANDIDLNNDVSHVNWSIVTERVSPCPFSWPIADERFVFIKVNDVSSVKRTPEELRIKWLGDRRPSVNHSEWSATELDTLKSIVKRRQEQNQLDWVEVAKELGVGSLYFSDMTSLNFSSCRQIAFQSTACDVDSSEQSIPGV